MKTKEELLELFKENEFDSYKVIVENDLVNSMQLENLEELIKFAKRQNINTLFYRYLFMDEDDLSITNKILSSYNLDGEAISVLRAKVDEYNESLLKLDYNKPLSLIVYCIYQGIPFYTEEYDFWFEKDGIDIPENACLKLIETHMEYIVEEKQDKRKLIDEGRAKLYKQIINDEEFHKCTNADFRRNYHRKLLKKDKEVEKLFYTSETGWYDITLGNFIEEVWRDYKSSLKKQ